MALGAWSWYWVALEAFCVVFVFFLVFFWLKAYAEAAFTGAGLLALLLTMLALLKPLLALAWYLMVAVDISYRAWWVLARPWNWQCWPM